MSPENLTGESVGCTSEQDLTKQEGSAPNGSRLLDPLINWSVLSREAIAVMELLDDEEAMRSYLQRCERDRSHFECPRDPSMRRRVKLIDRL